MCWVAGGQLVVATLYVNDAGEYNGNTKTIKTNTFHHINEIWKNMRNDGIITEVGIEVFVRQLYYGT